MSERDTHFAGFAHLLLDELKEKYAWIEPFQGEGSEMDDLYTYIARRAYDLVYHALKEAEEHDLFADDFWGRFRLSTEAKISEIPDMSAMPD